MVATIFTHWVNCNATPIVIFPSITPAPAWFIALIRFAMKIKNWKESGLEKPSVLVRFG